jgi:hypothetical protein
MKPWLSLILMAIGLAALLDLPAACQMPLRSAACLDLPAECK